MCLSGGTEWRRQRDGACWRRRESASAPTLSLGGAPSACVEHAWGLHGRLSPLNAGLARPSVMPRRKGRGLSHLPGWWSRGGPRLGGAGGRSEGGAHHTTPRTRGREAKAEAGAPGHPNVCRAPVFHMLARPRPPRPHPHYRFKASKRRPGGVAVRADMVSGRGGRRASAARRAVRPRRRRPWAPACSACPSRPHALSPPCAPLPPSA